jgi:hypothetical protein
VLVADDLFDEEKRERNARFSIRIKNWAFLFKNHPRVHTHARKWKKLHETTAIEKKKRNPSRTSQNFAPIWLPHWPACMWTISLRDDERENVTMSEILERQLPSRDTKSNGKKKNEK